MGGNDGRVSCRGRSENPYTYKTVLWRIKIILKIKNTLDYSLSLTMLKIDQLEIPKNLGGDTKDAIKFRINESKLSPRLAISQQNVFK